jgi:hypothetical protein
MLSEFTGTAPAVRPTGFRFELTANPVGIIHRIQPAFSMEEKRRNRKQLGSYFSRCWVFVPAVLASDSFDHASVRLSRQIIYPIFLTIYIDNKGMLVR